MRNPGWRVISVPPLEGPMAVRNDGYTPSKNPEEDGFRVLPWYLPPGGAN